MNSRTAGKSIPCVIDSPEAGRAYLRKRWPELFGWGVARPLATNTKWKLRKAIKSLPIEEQHWIEYAMRRHVGQPHYLLAVASGEQRVTLDGEAADVPNERHRAHAVEQLRRLQVRQLVNDANKVSAKSAANTVPIRRTTGPNTAGRARHLSLVQGAAVAAHTTKNNRPLLSLRRAPHEGARP